MYIYYMMKHRVVLIPCFHGSHRLRKLEQTRQLGARTHTHAHIHDPVIPWFCGPANLSSCDAWDSKVERLNAIVEQTRDQKICVRPMIVIKHHMYFGMNDNCDSQYNSEFNCLKLVFNIFDKHWFMWIMIFTINCKCGSLICCF